RRDWNAKPQAAARARLTGFATPIAVAPQPIDMSGTEAALANWITDAMRSAMGTELALTNRQHYRGEKIPAGKVDMLQLLDAMSISDRCLVTARLSGRDLLEILDDNVPDPKKDRHYV